MSLEGKGVDSTGVHTLQSGQFFLVLVHQICKSGEERKEEKLEEGEGKGYIYREEASQSGD